MKTKFLAASAALLALPVAALALQPGGTNPDANKDGVVTLAEHKAAVAKRFAEFDTNKDGKLTKAEMTAAHDARKDGRDDRRDDRREAREAEMAERLKDASPQERARFAQIQAKEAELRQLREGMKGDRQAAMWAESDANKDGTLSLAEFQGHAAKRFAEMDKNKNGQIDKDERPAKGEGHGRKGGHGPHGGRGGRG